MRAPPFRASMERRLLVNYRVDPQTLAATLPPPFRPALVGSFGLAGVCLIRLGGVRPAGLPAAVGLTTENAAHRVAVCWDTAEGSVTGVYIPRRDTSSRLAAWAGGRLFPGRQHHARFNVEEGGSCYRIEVVSRDGAVRVTVAAHVAETVMPGSVFADVEAASEFFRCAPLGYAATDRAGVFDGVELATDSWHLSALHVDETSSTFFDDPASFPPGTAVPDSAFLMSGLATTWHPQRKLVATTKIDWTQ